MTRGEVVAELAASFPDEDATAGNRTWGFVALPASNDGRSAVDVDEMLAEGFGRN
ncbi:MAG: hypothetical protein WBM50_12910 [Acidimicrobiales bacterium]